MAMQYANSRDWEASEAVAREETIAEFIFNLEKRWLQKMISASNRGKLDFHKALNSPDSDVRNRFKQEVFNEFLGNVAARRFKSKEIKQSLYYFIRSKLYEIDFTTVMMTLNPREPSYFEELIDHISEKNNGENISRVVMNMMPGENCVNSKLITIKVRDMLLNLGALRYLEMDKYHVRLCTLMEICKQLKTLRELIVKLTDFHTILSNNNGDIIQDFISSFCNLRTFWFSSLISCDGPSANNEEKLLHLCIVHLHSLEYVGNRNSLLNMTRSCIALQSEKSNLKCLTLHVENAKPLPISFKKFPDVEKLRLKCDASLQTNRINIDVLSELHTLKKLELYNLHLTQLFEEIIQIFGKGLKSLVLENKEEPSDDLNLVLESIQEKCLVLEELQLINISRLNTSIFSRRKFSNLTHLVVKMRNGYRNETILLRTLLNAPNLMFVQLESILVTNYDLLELADLTSGNLILEKILHFELNYKLWRDENEICGLARDGRSTLEMTLIQQRRGAFIAIEAISIETPLVYVTLKSTHV